MRKKFVCLLMSVLSLFVFAGCANVEYHRVIDGTGQIVDRLIIELEEDKILEKMTIGELTSLKQDIEGDFNDYIQRINNLKPHLQVENPDMDFSTGIVAEKTTWLSSSENISKITLQIVYKNSEYLQALNGSKDEEGDDNTEIINNLFISKYMMYADNAFSTIGESEYYNYYANNYNKFSIEDVSLTQVYGTTDTRLHSDADYKENIDGIIYHLWDIETADDLYKTKQLSYYYRTAVGTGWYILALGLSLGIAIVLIIVYIIKKHDMKKHTIKIDLTKEGNNNG